MKKFKILIVLIYLISNQAFAQNASSVNVSLRIAQKMKDTLQLSNIQFNNIKQINIAIANNKSLIRSQVSTRDSIMLATQRVENTRDSLYGTVLTNEQKLLYLQKKRTLVSNN